MKYLQFYGDKLGDQFNWVAFLFDKEIYLKLQFEDLQG